VGEGDQVEQAIINEVGEQMLAAAVEDEYNMVLYETLKELYGVESPTASSSKTAAELADVSKQDSLQVRKLVGWCTCLHGWVLTSRRSKTVKSEEITSRETGLPALNPKPRRRVRINPANHWSLHSIVKQRSEWFEYF
jgi:hypothetical protein